MPISEQEFPVSQAIGLRFSLGLRTGLDPDAAEHGAPINGHAITSLRSRWLHGCCKVCGHTFRPGDEVFVRDSGQVVHDMPGLRCNGSEAGNAEDSGGQSAFYRGLAEAWPMPDDVPLIQLREGHWLLAPPRAGLRRHACRVCGHSFRPMDHVVLCPCTPNAPRCRVAVHRDLIRQMHCYDQWLNGSQNRCLAY